MQRRRATDSEASMCFTHRRTYRRVPMGALMKGQPDNPITETGVLAEFKRSAFRTRFGQHRADLKHQPLDLLPWAAPYLAIAGGVSMLAHTRPARRVLR